jgi:prepilin-type processing-associated H-X9-DG protein
MSEEKRKEKRQKIKNIISYLLVALSCLFIILAFLPLLVPFHPPPDDWLWCQSNLATLGRAMLIYANDYNDILPTPSKWCDLLIDYGDVSKNHFFCRSAKNGPCNYSMNRNIENMGSIYKTKAPADMVVLFESYPGWNQVGGSEILTTTNHRGEGCNVLFLDCHVEFVKKQDLHKLKWKPDETQQE